MQVVIGTFYVLCFRRYFEGMTSLASQLKSLALPHTQAILGDERKRVSLLFDPTEAANLDKEAVFAVGEFSLL